MLSLQTSEYVAIVILLLAAYAISATLTQAGQAWLARWLGDDTGERIGWLSLNPFDHVNLFGAVCVVFLGIGPLRIMPVDYDRFERHEGRLFIVCMGQVIISIMIAIIAFLLLIIQFGQGLAFILADFQHYLSISQIAQFYPEKSTLSIVFGLLLVALAIYNLLMASLGFFINIVNYFIISHYKNGVIASTDLWLGLMMWGISLVLVLIFGLALRDFFFKAVIKSVTFICRLFGA